MKLRQEKKVPPDLLHEPEPEKKHSEIHRVEEKKTVKPKYLAKFPHISLRPITIDLPSYITGITRGFYQESLSLKVKKLSFKLEKRLIRPEKYCGVQFLKIRPNVFEFRLSSYNKRMSIGQSPKYIFNPKVSPLNVGNLSVNYNPTKNTGIQIYPSLTTSSLNFHFPEYGCDIESSSNPFPRLNALKIEPLYLNVETTLISTTNPQLVPIIRPTLKLSNLEEYATDLSHKSSQVLTPNSTTKLIEIESLKFDYDFEVVSDYTPLDFVKVTSKLLEGEIMSVFEELFNVRGYLPRGGSEALDKPVLIILGEDKKDWHNIIAYVLSELYREIKGEKPVPTIRELGEEDVVDSTTEKFLMTNFKIWGRIEMVDARDYNRTDFKLFLRKLRGRIISSYLQGLGFFVVITKNEHVSEVSELLKEVKGVNLIVIRPEYRVVRSDKGLLEIPMNEDKIEERYRNCVFSTLGLEGRDFLASLEERDKELRKVLKSFSPFVTKTESEGEHYSLKTAVFSYLVEEEFKKLDRKPKNREEFIKMLLNLLKSKISVEEAIILGDRQVIPDIIYKDDEIVYVEVESLIGTGDPISKIQSTISKYIVNDNIAVDGEIWIVLRPVSATIHYEDLKSIEEVYDTLLENNPIKFKVLVNKSGKWALIDLNDFIKKLELKDLSRIT